MNLPFEYDHGVAARRFGGATADHHATSTTRASSSCRCRSIARRRTCRGTRNGPHEILLASSHMELWDEEIADRRPRHRHLHAAGDGVAVRRAWTPLMDEIQRVAVRDARARQVPGDARRRALDHAAARRPPRPRSIPGCRCCRSTRTPTCATATWARRTTTPARCAAALEYAPVDAGRASAACRPRKPRPRPALQHDDLLRLQHARSDPALDRPRGRHRWASTVYITIDVDGLDPAIMPATGTPEPGGLSWYEIARAAPRHHRAAQRRRLRRRRAQPDAGHDRAELPVREADLQDPRPIGSPDADSGRNG